MDEQLSLSRNLPQAPHYYFNSTGKNLRLQDQQDTPQCEKAWSMTDADWDSRSRDTWYLMPMTLVRGLSKRCKWHEMQRCTWHKIRWTRTEMDARPKILRIHDGRTMIIYYAHQLQSFDATIATNNWSTLDVRTLDANARRTIEAGRSLFEKLEKQQQKPRRQIQITSNQQNSKWIATANNIATIGNSCQNKYKIMILLRDRISCDRSQDDSL